MIIKTAEFVKSSGKWQECPEPSIPEYAFIGRSNVGKSSLINAMMNHKDLAKTSGTPGKTQLINHFLVNENWYLTDLPGYGYAKVSKTLRQGFQEFIKDYFLQREQLICTFVLVDSRLEPQKIDLEFMEFLGENGIPFCIVFTKSDKLKLSQLNRNVQIYSKTMTSTVWESMPPYFTTSATDASGKDELLAFIDDLNQKVLENS